MQNDNSTTSQQSPWIPLRSAVTPILRQNIEYLAAFDPALHEQIKTNAGDEELLLQEIQGMLRCRTLSEPARWIFGENNPRQELTEVSNRLRQVPRDTSLMVLVGTAGGYAFKLFAESFLKNPQSVLLILDPTAARVRLCMLHTDIRKVLRTGRLHWAIGESDADSVFSAIDAFNLWGRRNVYLLDPTDANWEASLHRFRTEYAERSLPRERQRAERIEFLKERAASAKRRIERVLLFDCWERFPQGIHIRSIERALRERGIETKTVPLDGVRIDLFDAEYRRLRERSLLQTLNEFHPNLILSYAYHAPQIAGREIFEAAGVPWLQVVSNFAYYDSAYYANEYSAIVERRMIPGYEKRGAPHPFFVPLMANYVAECPAQTTRRYPVVFVGNPFTTPPDEYEQFRRRFQPRPSLWRQIQDTVGEISDFDRGLNLFDYLQAHPLPQIENDRETYDIFRYLLCVTAENRRRSLLERIADEGLALFGNWETVLRDSPLRICYQRYLPIQEEPSLFSEGHIFINIHTAANVTSPNMRFFNVAGMGGFLLSDGEFSDFLQPDAEMVQFISGDELLEKVRYYNAHPEQADEIRAQGYERVRRQWTYAHWIEWVFRELSINQNS